MIFKPFTFFQWDSDIFFSTFRVYLKSHTATHCCIVANLEKTVDTFTCHYTNNDGERCTRDGRVPDYLNRQVPGHLLSFGLVCPPRPSRRIRQAIRRKSRIDPGKQYTLPRDVRSIVSSGKPIFTNETQDVPLFSAWRTRSVSPLARRPGTCVHYRSAAVDRFLGRNLDLKRINNTIIRKRLFFLKQAHGYASRWWTYDSE